MIVPPTSAPCPEPRPWASYLVSELASVNVTVARSLAAIGIRTAAELYDEVEAGIELTDLSGVGATTADKIRAELPALREGVLYTERLRNAAKGGT